MKKTEKQNVEKIRQKIAKDYKEKFTELGATNKKLILENSQLKSQIHELEEELRKKEDWNRRLLEYKNLSEKDLENLKNQAEGAAEIQKTFGRIVSSFMVANVLNQFQ